MGTSKGFVYSKYAGILRNQGFVLQVLGYRVYEFGTHGLRLYTTFMQQGAILGGYRGHIVCAVLCCLYKSEKMTWKLGWHMHLRFRGLGRYSIVNQNLYYRRLHETARL